MPITKQYRYYIGIDVGVNTGLAIWDKLEKRFVEISTLKIHQAIKDVEAYVFMFPESTFIRVEDARLRKWFGTSGKEQLQGAGSVKRDSSIWDDFLKDIKAYYEMVAPKQNKTKLEPDYFKKITGCTQITSKHSRDAAMLVFNF